MTTIGLFHGLVGGYGGGDRVVISLARGLLHAGYKVKVFAFGLRDDDTAFRNFGERIPSDVELVSLVPLISKFKYFGIYQNLFSENFIVFAESNSDLIVQTGGGSQPVTKRKYQRIAYCQALWRSHIDGKYQSGLWRLYAIPYSIIMGRRLINLRNAKHLVLLANSNYTKEYLVTNYDIPDSDVSVIYPPVNIKQWEAKNNGERSGVVNVSRFSQEKNHSLMFEIIKDMQVTLTLIGNTLNLAKELYFRKLQQNAPVNVKFLKNVPHGTLLNELRKAKVYLHASHETFGLTVVEAIAAGCIPVVPNHSANKETVPFSELRYNNITEAGKIIHDVFRGEFDYLRPRLQEHIKQFDEAIFHSKMVNVIKGVLNGRYGFS